MCVQVMRLTIRHSGDPPIRRGLQNLILDALTAFAYQNDGYDYLYIFFLWPMERMRIVLSFLSTV